MGRDSHRENSPGNSQYSYAGCGEGVKMWNQPFFLLNVMDRGDEGREVIVTFFEQ